MTGKRTGVVLVALDEDDFELVSAVQRLGRYDGVELGYLADNSPSLSEAIERLVSNGMQRILLVPTLKACGDSRVQTALATELANQQLAHPEVEVVEIPTLGDPEHHARLLVNSLQQFEEGQGASETVPLSLVPAHERGTVQRLNGGHEFVSRLSALGFIPGSPVKVVQNYGVGPLIVSIRGTRIALGREEARKVRVCPRRRGGRGERGHRGRRHWRRGHFE